MTVMATVAAVPCGKPMPLVQRADLDAYDAILKSASRLTFWMQRKRKNAWVLFRVDADATAGAFWIVVNHDRAQPGKCLRNKAPYRAFVADVVVGASDGGRVVQTISSGGVSDLTHAITTGRHGVASQSMDRGAALELTATPGAFFDPLLRCVAPRASLTVDRGGDRAVRLVATPALNGAVCRRAWFDTLIGLPTLCAGTVCVSCCCAAPPARHEVQDGAGAPLGDARYTVPHYTFCTEACCYRGQPVGATVDLGSLPVDARRDVVAAVAHQIGMTSTMPDTG